MTLITFRDNDAAYLFFENSVLKLSDIYNVKICSVEGPAGQDKNAGPWVLKLNQEPSTDLEYRFPNYNAMVRGYIEEISSNYLNQNICPNLWPEKERIDLISKLRGSWGDTRRRNTGQCIFKILEAEEAAAAFEKSAAITPTRSAADLRSLKKKVLLNYSYGVKVHDFVQGMGSGKEMAICPELWSYKTIEVCLNFMAKLYPSLRKEMVTKWS